MLLLTAMVLSSAAIAEAPPPVATEDKMICKREPVLGSRIKVKRTCMTAEDWKAHEEAMRHQKRDIQNAAAPRPD